MHKDKEGKDILKELNIDAFVEINDNQYAFTREMLHFINRKRKNITKSHEKP